MGVRAISKPVWNRQTQKYQIRWVEDGKRRTRTTFDDKPAAEIFRRELVAQMAAESPTPKKRGPKPKPPAPLVSVDLGGEEEAVWSRELEFYRDAVREAYDARDDVAMELASKASRAVSTLVTAHASNRDVRRLKAALEELKAWRKSLAVAGQHGTRVESAGGGDSAPGGPLRRDDAVH